MTVAPTEAPTVTLEVARYQPGRDERPTFERYDVPNRPEWVVLDALNYLKDQVDGTLSYRWSCRMGICGSCGIMLVPADSGSTRRLQAIQPVHQLHALLRGLSGLSE
jgi:succinate dehydrogenase/fumarate reductase-like Fe-S protein